MERTLVIIKPDGVGKGLIGDVISRYEKKGLVISQMKMLTPNENILEKHYEEHIDKPFYSNLIQFMTSGKVVVMVASGEKAVEAVRMINGATNPLEADSGSIRGSYAVSITKNIVHGSDSLENAEREINIWFN